MLTLMLFAGISVQVPWVAVTGKERVRGVSPPIEVSIDATAGTITVEPYDFSTDAVHYNYQTQAPDIPGECDLISCSPPTPGVITQHVDTLNPVRFFSESPIELQVDQVWTNWFTTIGHTYDLSISGTTDGVPWEATRPTHLAVSGSITRSLDGNVDGFTPRLQLGQAGTNQGGVAAVPEPSQLILLPMLCLLPLLCKGWSLLRRRCA